MCAKHGCGRLEIELHSQSNHIQRKWQYITPSWVLGPHRCQTRNINCRRTWVLGPNYVQPKYTECEIFSRQGLCISEKRIKCKNARHKHWGMASNLCPPACSCREQPNPTPHPSRHRKAPCHPIETQRWPDVSLHAEQQTRYVHTVLTGLRRATTLTGILQTTLWSRCDGNLARTAGPIWVCEGLLFRRLRPGGACTKIRRHGAGPQT